MEDGDDAPRPSAAFRVLTHRGLLQLITSFQAGLPFLVGAFNASLVEADGSTRLGNYRGKLPQFAVRRRDEHMLALLQRATQNPRLRALPQLQFCGVRRCAIEYNSLHLLRWLQATRANSPTLTDEYHLLGVAVTSYFDNPEILDWLSSASEGPHESIETVTLPEVCRAAGLGNENVIYWLHQHGSSAFSPLVMDTAAAHGHLGIVRFLHERRSEGCTTRAMHGAALNGYDEVVTYLAQNRQEGPQMRTLEMAASGGRLRCVKALCRFAKPPTVGDGGWRLTEARQCALQAGYPDVARFLAEQTREMARHDSTNGVDARMKKGKRRLCCGLF